MKAPTLLAMADPLGKALLSVVLKLLHRLHRLHRSVSAVLRPEANWAPALPLLLVVLSNRFESMRGDSLWRCGRYGRIGQAQSKMNCWVAWIRSTWC